MRLQLQVALHYAAMRSHDEIVRLLCDRGADVEARCHDGSRPLHRAAMNGHISVVKELIEVRNAEINAGWSTALMIARHYNKPDIAAYLVSHGGIRVRERVISLFISTLQINPSPFILPPLPSLPSLSICQKDFTQNINSKFLISNRVKVTQPLQQHNLILTPLPLIKSFRKNSPSLVLVLF